MVSQYREWQPPAAPIERAELEQALRPFGESRMLPSAAYVDPSVFEWERRRFFGDGWMCVAHSEQLPEPGDQRAEAIGAGSVLLVRGDDGALRAFANTCRHRGHELLSCGEAARHKMIICPYHAWTYSLAGELRAAGSFKTTPGFDFGQWGLARLPVTEWHGLVFVDASGGAAAPLEEVLVKLDELVAPYEPEHLVTAGRHSYDAAANWKIITENYHECSAAGQSTPSCAGSARPRAARTTRPTAPGSAAGWIFATAWTPCH